MERDVLSIQSAVNKRELNILIVEVRVVVVSVEGIRIVRNIVISVADSFKNGTSSFHQGGREQATRMSTLGFNKKLVEE